MTAERDIAKQIAAAKTLRESLAAIVGDDPDLIRDSIEGETGLHEAIAAVEAQIREDEMLCLGIAEMIKTLDARKARLTERVIRCRVAIQQAMVIGELPALTLADATLSLKYVPPKVEIVNEMEIPAKFWFAREPSLDKKALREALVNGEKIPGAVLGNGSQTLAIRRS